VSLYEFPAIYDRAFAEFTASDVRAVIAAFGSARCAIRTVLEPACGTGRVLRALARRGFRTLGFDADPGMVARARGRRALAGRAGRISVARMEAFAPERFRCDAAFNLHHSIAHLLSGRDVRRHFDLMARAIRPGGIYAVGIWTVGSKPLPARGERIGIWGSAPRARPPWRLSMRVASRNLRARREIVAWRLLIGRGAAARRFEGHYPLRTYTLSQWEDMIRRLKGFSVAAVLSANGARIRPPEGDEAVYVLLRRP